MDVMVNDITDLFSEYEVAHDETGSLLSIGAILLNCDPILILLSDAEGYVIADEMIMPEGNFYTSKELAIQLLDGLDNNSTYFLRVPYGEDLYLAFAIRLSDSGRKGFVGGVVRNATIFEKHLGRIQDVLPICGDLAWTTIHEWLSNNTLQVKLEHLANEKDTLKASHARAVAQAIEEHEKRLHEQQESMMRLERLLLQNKMILHSAGEGIFGLNRDGNISFVNPAGAEMVGWNPDKLVGNQHHVLIHHTKMNGKPYSIEECPIHATLRNGTVSTADNEIFWRKDGTSFPVEYTNTPIWEDEEIVGAVLTFRDTTERKALELQLTQAQKLESIGQLAAGIAHEINTPTQYIGDNTRFFQDALGELQTVLQSFDRLLKAAKNKSITDDLINEVQAAIDEVDMDYLTEEMSSAVEQSLEGVGRVASIVRSMKEFSHPGTNQKQCVDINRSLENTLIVSRNEWKYVAETVTNLDPTLPPVSCLPGECNQVFLNLIVNATHAIIDKIKSGSKQKGLILISTLHKNGWAEIRIQDNGTGIPEEARSRVMDPFFTTKEVGRGTGQGLAMAHSVIVDKHKGTLTFETESGEGTTFIIRLPIDAERSLTEGVLGDEEDIICR